MAGIWAITSRNISTDTNINRFRFIDSVMVTDLMFHIVRDDPHSRIQGFYYLCGERSYIRKGDGINTKDYCWMSLELRKLNNLSWIGLMGLLSTLIVGCGDSGSSNSGSLNVSVTDAPINYSEVEAVVIHFTGVTVKGPQGEATYSVKDPVTGEPSRSVDLLALSGGKSVVLLEEELEQGKYNWIRLDTDPTKTYIVVNGQQFELRCTSCEQNGFKLNRSFDIEENGAVALTVDVDLNKSITDPQSGEHYQLRPTARVVETALAGMIGGTVSDTVIADLGGEIGCTVYVFEGDVNPDDIYLPELGAPGNHTNPEATARVEYDDSTQSYVYKAAYLPAGEYTVALTCDADSDDILENDDTIAFYGADTVTVAEKQTTVHDFNAAAPGSLPVR